MANDMIPFAEDWEANQGTENKAKQVSVTGKKEYIRKYVLLKILYILQ